MGEKLTVEQAKVLIVEYVRSHPDLRYSEIGEHFGYSESRTSKLAKAAGIPPRKRGVRFSNVDAPEGTHAR